MLNIVTFNTCNLGADAPPERLRRLGTLFATELRSADVIALQEIMAPAAHAGAVAATSAYQALVAAIVAAGGVPYQFREVAPLADADGGMDGANIRVGLLFNPQRVSFADRGAAGALDAVGISFHDRQPHLTLNPGRIAPQHPAFIGDERCHWAASRKPLAAEFMLGEQRLFVIVCHLKSKRALNRRTEDYAKRQRHVQAQIIHNFAADLLACDRQAALVVLGDMNDLPGSKTLKALKGDGLLHNLIEDVAPELRYTRRHGAQAQALDHILVSPALRSGATVRIVHLQRPAEAAISDHDPVLATLPALAGTTLQPQLAEGRPN